MRVSSICTHKFWLNHGYPRQLLCPKAGVDPRLKGFIKDGLLVIGTCKCHMVLDNMEKMFLMLAMSFVDSMEFLRWLTKELTRTRVLLNGSGS
jgi:hypothetical protein